MQGRALITLAAMAHTVFIGGGNMASALIGGCLKSGTPAGDLLAVEPDPGQRERLAASFGVAALAAPEAAVLAAAELVVWAVKPQSFAAAAAACAGGAGKTLHLSVMAGVRSAALATATGSGRIVRAMPNTPALIGAGIAALFATPAATGADRDRCEALLASTGAVLWVDEESQLDAVTALSGSGPAYVFYLIEAMAEAGAGLGLPAGQALQLALQTVRGSALLAAQSGDAPQVLRERVTSKGGTTQAALETLDAYGVHAAIVAAIDAAARRARELGDASTPVTAAGGA